jgi:hypothetical protein
MTSDQLPAVIRPGAPATSDDIHLVPALIADAGDQAPWRYLEFFTANIRNPNTRRAYARACQQFFAWCDERGLTLMTIRPVDVARYIETRQQTHSAPDVKQQLAAVRMVFNWLITGQVVPLNPAAAARGPKHVVKTGKTPVLEGNEWRTLIESIPTETLRDLRDRALIATLTYSFARIADKAEHAILSTYKFPQGTRHVHAQDGVVLVSPARVVGIATIIRGHITQMYTCRSTAPRSSSAHRAPKAIAKPPVPARLTTWRELRYGETAPASGLEPMGEPLTIRGFAERVIALDAGRDTSFSVVERLERRLL